MVSAICRQRNFNPRSREGSDTSQFKFPLSSTVFQSTLPRRERRWGDCRPGVGKLNFNPRSREGSDFFEWTDKVVCNISIHAPAKGATLNTLSFIFLLFRFQSTLPRRERHSRNINPADLMEFQSTLPRRERQQYYTTNFIFFV